MTYFGAIMATFCATLIVVPSLCRDTATGSEDHGLDDLDHFLSDLPMSKMPDLLQGETIGDQSTTTELPPPQCYRNGKPMVFPPNLFSNKSTHYPFQESGLQIFLGMKIPCDGYLTAWQFLSAHTVIWGLHFGVFRRTCFDVFQLVSDTYINGQTTGTLEEKWVAWKPANPIPVKRGDVIGIFYDHINTASKSVAVRSVTLPDNYKYAPKQFSKSEALVFLSDAQSLAKSHGCVRMAAGRITRRIPALFILMTPEYRGRLVPSPTRALPMSTTTQIYTPVNTMPPREESPIDPNAQESNNLVPLNGQESCDQLPKFEFSCERSLSVRYYYDRISKVCRQFLFCPTNQVAAKFGFSSQSDCMYRCSDSSLVADSIAIPAARNAQSQNPAPRGAKVQQARRSTGKKAVRQVRSTTSTSTTTTMGEATVEPVEIIPLQNEVDEIYKLPATLPTSSPLSRSAVRLLRQHSELDVDQQAAVRSNRQRRNRLPYRRHYRPRPNEAGSFN